MIRTTAKGRSIDTHLTDEEALAICATLPGSFPQDLVRKSTIGRGLSRDQLTWVHILAIESNKPVEDAIHFPLIAAIFLEASAHLKFPRMRFLTSEGEGVVIVMAGKQSRYPGNLHISDGGPFGANRYFGRIDTEGQFHSGPCCNGDVLRLLEAIEVDPAGACAAYGHLTGSCCFCGQELTDERSIAVGYGPVCAKHYSLPWGEKKEEETPQAGGSDLIEVCVSCGGNGERGSDEFFAACLSCNGKGVRPMGTADREEEAMKEKMAR